MKPKLLLCLALVLSSLLAGCVTQREFRGSTANLKGEGNQTSNTNFLKMSVTGSGVTTNGGNYIVFSLPDQKCRLVLFYPKMKRNQSDYLRAELGTNHTHAWQLTWGYQSTNYILVNEELPQNQTGVWLIRGKQFDWSRLGLGVEGRLPVNAERLIGQIEMVGVGDSEFNFDVDLSGGNGVKLSGIFDSFKKPWALWGYPAVLILGENWSWPEWPRKPDIVDSKPLRKITISVRGNVNHPGIYSVAEGTEDTTVYHAIEIAGGRAHQSDVRHKTMENGYKSEEISRIYPNQLRVKRTENGKQEIWTLDISEPLGSSFILIQGDEIEVPDG
ncbi:MAG: hypothetical protein WBS33_12895 [Verrucomicrobiia bacterium]